MSKIRNTIKAYLQSDTIWQLSKRSARSPKNILLWLTVGISDPLDLPKYHNEEDISDSMETDDALSTTSAQRKNLSALTEIIKQIQNTNAEKIITAVK